MDKLLDGLDCRLMRVSGMVADSIMMGIVNSAMEVAYEKSCSSKEGDLERLNDKSRFCELAVMQLDWCLKLLEDEVDSYNVVESAQDREKLLSDLEETRNRIQCRLEETELAIADKDQEISSLHAELQFERMTSKGVDARLPIISNTMNAEKKINGDHDLSELKDNFDQEMYKIQAKLDDGKQSLMDLMEKLHVFSLTMVKFGQDFCSEEEKEIDSSRKEEQMDRRQQTHHERSKFEALNFQLMEQLKSEIEEIASHTDGVNRVLNSASEMMENFVSLFRGALDEQQWKWNIQKGMHDTIIQSSMRDVQRNFNKEPEAGGENSDPFFVDKKWSALMDDITSLHEDLVMLATKMDVKEKTTSATELRMRYPSSMRGTQRIEEKSEKGNALSVADSRSDSRIAGEGKCAQESHKAFVSDVLGKPENTEYLSKESEYGHSVAERIKNHESIIRKKSEEISWLKGELSREKASTLRDDVDLDSTKKMIAKIILQLESIKKENKELVAVSDYYGGAHGRDENFQLNDLAQLPVEKEMKVLQTSGWNPENLGKRSCCHLIDSELCKDTRQLKQEKVDLDMKAMILEETYAILFKGLVKRMHVESFDYDIETIIREDIWRTVLGDTIKVWNDDRQTYGIEKLLMNEIQHFVFGELVKNLKEYANLFFENCQQWVLQSGDNPFDKQKASGRIDIMQEVDFPSNRAKVQGDSFANVDKPHISLDAVSSENKDLRYNQHGQKTVENEDTHELVEEKFKTSLKTRGFSMMEPRGDMSSPDFPGHDRDNIQDHVASTIDRKIENGEQWQPNIYEEAQLHEFNLFLKPFTKFSRALTDFQHMAYEKIGADISRLEELNNNFNPLLEHIGSTKKNELLYRKAFTRRCYDLQTAEVEVDLLGDEVDLLRGLLDKIYMTLNHYSPVLQHYFGIMDLLRLIRCELSHEACSTSKQ